ncbi:MAG: DNA internalization-related competence protein ComEC/Rec2 [Oscillospiraceae bacterium]|nr:DNA internalization-related competence protein ComEC/Rec2 [Oscillospiraceae bacterium]
MRKLATAVFSFSAAILISRYFQLYDIQLILCAACAVFSLFGLLFRGNRRLRIFIILLSLSAGFLWSFVYTVVFIEPHFDFDDEIKTAVVTDFPVARHPRGYHVDVKLQRSGLSAIGARLYYYNEKELKPGEFIRFSASIRRTDTSDDGSRLDTLSSRGLFLSAYVSGDIEVTKASGDIRYLPKIIANAVSTKIKEIFSPDVSHFLQALLMGKRDDLYQDAALTASLSASGIIHIVSISGMHISFLMGFLSVVIRNRKLFAIYAIPILILFMAMTGFTPAVTRAGIMQIFITFAPGFKRDNDSITSLSAALFVLLASNPYACASVGLQLSFSATLGIIIFTSRINNNLTDAVRKSRTYKKKLPKALINYTFASLSTTIGALVFTLPLTAIHFGYISLIAPVTNLLTIGIVSLIFPIGLLTALLGFISPFLAGILAVPVELAAGYIIFVAHILSLVPYSLVYSSSSHIMLWLAYVYILFITLPFFKPRMRQYIYPVCISLILLLSVIFVSHFIPVTSDNNRITVLDVGQGLSVVVTSGENVMVVDCGSSGGIKAGEITHEYLLNHGFTSIDLLVITHFHTDHVNGIEFLLSRINVSALVIPDPDGSYLAEDIINLARRRGSDIIYVTKTLSASLGEQTVILYPPLGFGDENELGLTVLTSGDITALITGDMNSATEKSLLQMYELPKLDLLVVGHHGSRNSTSQELLDALQPDIAIIPVGRNSFGHPHRDTLNRLTAIGAKIYRTDEAGHITITGK